MSSKTKWDYKCLENHLVTEKWGSRAGIAIQMRRHTKKGWRYKRYFKFIRSKSNNIVVRFYILCKRQEILNFKIVHVEPQQALSITKSAVTSLINDCLTV